MWKDKHPVLLISTHALPIRFPCVLRHEVPLRNRAVKEDIPTSPVLLEYTTFMRGIDVANQLQASYLSLTQSHKWWHCVFFCHAGYCRGQQLHYVFIMLWRRSRSSAKTNEPFAIQDCIMRGTFRRLEGIKRTEERSVDSPPFYLYAIIHTFEKVVCCV